MRLWACCGSGGTTRRRCNRITVGRARRTTSARERPALIPNAEEECLRRASPVCHFRRTATRDAEGADLLGVAGGDGTQALVAAVAAEHDVPFLVISAGTRNHFAMDLGLDRDDPSTCLDALTDGVELRVDLGFANDNPFVNNASFGAYAAIVQSPAYRDVKVRTTLEMLPELLTREKAPV